ALAGALFFFFQAEDGIRDFHVTGVQTCALPIYVFLPTVAVTMLTPYVHDTTTFAILLPVLLVAMYGALWVANSQQLEKRRGERRSEERRVGKECGSRRAADRASDDGERHEETAS